MVGRVQNRDPEDKKSMRISLFRDSAGKFHRCIIEITLVDGILVVVDYNGILHLNFLTS